MKDKLVFVLFLLDSFPSLRSPGMTKERWYFVNYKLTNQPVNQSTNLKPIPLNISIRNLLD